MYFPLPEEVSNVPSQAFVQMCQFHCLSIFPLLSLPVTVEQSFPLITLPAISICVSAMELGIWRLHEPHCFPSVAICSTMSLIQKSGWQCVCVWLGGIFVCVIGSGEKLSKCSQSTYSLPRKGGMPLVLIIFQGSGNKRPSEDELVLWLRKRLLIQVGQLKLVIWKKGLILIFFLQIPVAF